jgi:tRNA (mo5U34)-methyltransferase
MSKLEDIRNQKWFYEFTLPDGSKTESYLPVEVKNIHKTRERVLRSYIENNRKDLSTAIDVSCHEGYFSLVLTEYFEKVAGIDKNADSLAKAVQITSLISKSEIHFANSSVEDWNERADFVLCYGLIYHVENPRTNKRNTLFGNTSIAVQFCRIDRRW